MSLPRFLVFFGVTGLIWTAIHVYLWLRLVRDPAWPDPWRGRATAALVVLGVATFATMLLTRSLPRSVLGPVAWVGMSWLGVAFYLLLFLGAQELVRLFAGGTTSFARTAAAVVVTAAVLVCAYGASVVARGPQAVPVRVAIRRLPLEFEGFRIVEISDIHVGPTTGRAFVEEVVRKVNALEPDLVAITGDLVDGSVERLARDVEPLRGLRARNGVFFVTGNHEYFSGADAWCDHVASLGVHPLRNERTQIVRGDAVLEVAGTDDDAGDSAGEGPDLAKALAGRDASRPIVLLSHRPRIMKEAERAGVDLVLAAHTHGGQLQPFGLVTRLVEPALSGLSRFGGTWLYVCNGTGYWGPPMRVLAPPEITVVELVGE